MIRVYRNSPNNKRWGIWHQRFGSRLHIYVWAGPLFVVMASGGSDATP